MVLNIEGTGSRGQEKPVLTALANIFRVFKGPEISPEIVTVFMNEC